MRRTRIQDKPPLACKGRPVEGPTVWYGADLTPEDVEFRLIAADLEEIDAAVRGVLCRGSKLEDVTAEDFPLPHLGPVLLELHRDLLFGRGIRVLRGLPVPPAVSFDEAADRHGVQWYAATALWGVTAHFGAAQSLTQAGHLLGHVRDSAGALLAAGSGRSNLGVHPMGYHNDNADIVFLLCVQRAPSGGASSCCSSHALHNEVLQRRPDLYEVLCGNYYQDRLDWIPDGAPPFYVSPVFHFGKDNLGVEAASASAEHFAGTPSVPDLQREALEFVQQVAAEPRLRYDRVLEPGDCLLNHNLTTFHARTPIGDGPADAQKRHMLRVWIASPLGWPDIDPLYAERWSTTEVGKRGGLRCPGTRPHVTIPWHGYFAELLQWYTDYPLATTTGLRKAGLLPLKAPDAAAAG